MQKLKVVIADDDPVILRDLKKSIAWDALDYTVIGIVPNGKAAFQLVKKYRPELVITDVVMPVMDGLELTGRINEQFPQTHVLLLSSYEDFSYVRKALEFGAVDYMLKTAVDMDALSRKLEKIHSDIVTSRTHTSEYRSLLLRKAFSTIGSAASIVTGEYAAPEWMISVPFYFTVLAVHTPFYMDVEEYTEALKVKISGKITRLRSHMEREDGYSEFLLFESGNMIIFGVPVSAVSQTGYRLLSSELQTELADTELLFFHVGNVSIVKFYKQLQGILPQLKYECLYCSFTARNCSAETLQNMVSLHLQKTGYVEISVREAAGEDVLPRILNGFLSYHENRDFYGILDYYHNFCHQLETLTDWKYQAPKNLFVHSYEELSCRISAMYRQCMQIRKELLQHRITFSPVVKAAIEYMENNMQNPDLVTADVAQAIDTGTATLRARFKEELGVSVTEYLTNLRIQTACRLLSGSSLRIYEISDRVGFRTSQYFSKVFSERMNYRPLEYRNAGIGYEK